MEAAGRLHGSGSVTNKSPHQNPSSTKTIEKIIQDIHAAHPEGNDPDGVCQYIKTQLEKGDLSQDLKATIKQELLSLNMNNDCHQATILLGSLYIGKYGPMNLGSLPEESIIHQGILMLEDSISEPKGTNNIDQIPKLKEMCVDARNELTKIYADNTSINKETITKIARNNAKGIWNHGAVCHYIKTKLEQGGLSQESKELAVKAITNAHNDKFPQGTFLLGCLHTGKYNSKNDALPKKDKIDEGIKMLEDICFKYQSMAEKEKDDPEMFTYLQEATLDASKELASIYSKKAQAWFSGPSFFSKILSSSQPTNQSDHAQKASQYSELANKLEKLQAPVLAEIEKPTSKMSAQATSLQSLQAAAEIKTNKPTDTMNPVYEAIGQAITKKIMNGASNPGIDASKVKTHIELGKEAFDEKIVNAKNELYEKYGIITTKYEDIAKLPEKKRATQKEVLSEKIDDWLGLIMQGINYPEEKEFHAARIATVNQLLSEVNKINTTKNLDTTIVGITKEKQDAQAQAKTALVDYLNTQHEEIARFIKTEADLLAKEQAIAANSQVTQTKITENTKTLVDTKINYWKNIIQQNAHRILPDGKIDTSAKPVNYQPSFWEKMESSVTELVSSSKQIETKKNIESHDRLLEDIAIIYPNGKAAAEQAYRSIFNAMHTKGCNLTEALMAESELRQQSTASKSAQSKDDIWESLLPSNKNKESIQPKEGKLAPSSPANSQQSKNNPSPKTTTQVKSLQDMTPDEKEKYLSKLKNEKGAAAEHTIALYTDNLSSAIAARLLTVAQKAHAAEEQFNKIM